MKHLKRPTAQPRPLPRAPCFSTSARLLAAALLTLSMIAAPLQAQAKAAKKPVAKTAASKSHGSSHLKGGKSVVAAGAAGHKSLKGAKGAKGGKHRNAQAAIPVISMPAPPVAQLTALTEATIQTGCLMLPLGAGTEGAAPLGVSPQQMQQLLNAATADLKSGDGAAARCAPFAAVSTPAMQAGMRPAAMAVAFLPADDRRALVATQLQANDAPAPHWQDLDSGLPAVREVWLQSTALLGASLEGNDVVPAYLMHELGLLVKHMRKQSGAGDSALVRVLVQGEKPGEGAGDDGEASLAAVELVDPTTGQALDSAVWVARDGEPGAYISSRGVEYERMLWQAPVDFRRISRGVGASSMLVHKRVVVKLKTKKGKKPRSKVVVRAFQYKSQHIGIDFAAATGTPVVSVAEGEVVFSGWRGGYGNLVIVQHGSELSTYYGHLSAFSSGLQEGMKVRRGQEIGLVGSTGFSTGPHLHFEIRKGAKYMDPSNPSQKLPAWTMAPQEQETVLTRLLQLEVTRPQAFMRTARAQQLMQPAGQ